MENIDFETREIRSVYGTLKYPIFRYFKIDNFFYDTILNNRLYFSDPKTFNDPFEERTRFVFPNYTDEEIDQFVLDNQLDINKKNNLKKWRGQIPQNDIYQINSRVICFSKKYSDILMWSHYSDKHQGVCLGFTPQEGLNDPVFFDNNTPAIEIRYTNDIPEYDFLKIRTKCQEELIKSRPEFVKSIDWIYEQEIRILKSTLIDKSDKIPDLFQFHKKNLVAVIFGCRCDETTRNNIMDLIYLTGYSKCKFFIANLSNGSFSLDFSELVPMK